MAAILDALAPYVTKLITDMAEEEVTMLLGVSGEITKLESNMESIKDFLADAERRSITDLSVQRWVRKLKDAMYDATDILDLCQLEADKRRESIRGSSEEKAPGCFQPLLFCLWNPLFAHKIGSSIKELNQRLDDIHKEAAKFHFINLSTYPRTSTAAAEHSSPRMTSEFIESAIVGDQIERETKDIVQVLIANDANHSDIKVVSIIGMGGIGKTTLAQKIFKVTTIDEHFKKKIWLSITQNFNDAELLRTAISHAGGRYHGGDQDMTLLIRTLTEALSSGRFLLVMDDVWGDQAWKHVLSVPVRNASLKQPGSRVLITTRSEDLARQMQISFHQHRVSPLDKEDAWSLLKKQLSPDQLDGIDQLKDTGMRIIDKCDGLPLAIKVMGGLLCTRYPSKHQWEDVLNDDAWSVTGLPNELDNRIYLSYEDLSPQLKQCFLYCSLLSIGTVIVQAKVIPMWISEGFIQSQVRSSSHDDRLEEVANGYYRELIKRNLIEPTRGAYYTGYECKMHDVVRTFAQFIVREESLVVQGDQDMASSNNSLVRRLSIASGKRVVLPILQKQKSLRTLIVNSITIEVCCLTMETNLICFSSLRVLFMSGIDSDRFASSLSQLRQLRYLHLEETNLTGLPDDIHRMRFLQHIVLDYCWNLKHLPSSIIKLAHLRSLNIDGSNVKVAPKGISGLKNLRTLKGFPIHMDTDGRLCSLEEIGPLSQLRNLSLYGLKTLSASSFAEKAMISNKEHLNCLCLNGNSNKYDASGDEAEKQWQQQQAIEEVFDKLCPPNCIENVDIEGGYFGRRLPNWMMAPGTMAFKSMRYLRLQNLPCCTQLPDGLSLLPCLEMLIIESAPAIKSVGLDFQASFSLAVGGSSAASARTPFPKLKVLQLFDLSEWEEWVWEEQDKDMTIDVIAMPALERLSIKNCKLKHLPQGLANSKRHALRELVLYDIANLTAVENFTSVVHLDVSHCPELKRMNGLSRLQKIKIVNCRNLEVLEGVPELDSMKLVDATMQTVPQHLRGLNVRYLKLYCSKKLYDFLKQGSPEWDKMSHIKKVDLHSLLF